MQEAELFPTRGDGPYLCNGEWKEGAVDMVPDSGNPSIGRINGITILQIRTGMILCIKIGRSRRNTT